MIIQKISNQQFTWSLFIANSFLFTSFIISYIVCKFYICISMSLVSVHDYKCVHIYMDIWSFVCLCLWNGAERFSGQLTMNKYQNFVVKGILGWPRIFKYSFVYVRICLFLYSCLSLSLSLSFHFSYNLYQIIKSKLSFKKTKKNKVYIQ